jgi:hypothetical protein
MKKKGIIVLYDKDDVLEFNIANINYEKVFLFSPGLEIFLKNKDELEIYKPNVKLNYTTQKKILLESEKIYKEYKNNFHYLEKLDKGIIENIHNILFVTTFSSMYLIENLREYENLSLFYKNEFYDFDNFENFIPLFIKKVFFKKNQGFFNYLKPKKVSNFKKFFIKLNNIICCIKKNSNNIIIVGSSLTKKIYKKTKQKIFITQLKSSYDFKFYHLILNLLTFINFFKKKKSFYFFPLENQFLKSSSIKNILEIFFNNFEEKNFKFFKNIVLNSLSQYCENQINLQNDIISITEHLKPKNVFVDQLRFGVATILASICYSNKINVILVPHGSISVPDSEQSKFVLTICARGLIYSKIANYSVAQSKISYEAIKYYDKTLKILKSEPLLFGKKILKEKLNRKKFTFLHASTPKSLSKWPWIYENYNEYIDNINDLIESLKHHENVELVIRFREGPECDLKTFKKLINIDLNKFVKISSNINFFEDLSYSNCLISFSSTSIEETLFLNKKVLVYFGNREYKHINYKFKEDSDIVYSDQKDIKYKLNIILSDRNKKDYDILWGEKIDIEDDLKKFYF